MQKPVSNLCLIILDSVISCDAVGYWLYVNWERRRVNLIIQNHKQSLRAPRTIWHYYCSNVGEHTARVMAVWSLTGLVADSSDTFLICFGYYNITKSIMLQFMLSCVNNMSITRIKWWCIFGMCCRNNSNKCWVRQKMLGFFNSIRWWWYTVCIILAVSYY